jgi:dipeptidyl-peptidase-3
MREHVLLAILLGGWSSAASAQVAPLPLPPAVRVQSSAPREIVWKKLSEKQQALVYHLTRAADAGRDLLYFQTHRHSLAIKQWIVEALSAEHIAGTKSLLGEEPFAEFLVYAAKFLDQQGPYAPSNRKYVLRTVTAEQIGSLLAQHAPDMSAPERLEVIALLTDPMSEVQAYPESADGRGLERTGGNYYEKGITGQEVGLALAASLKPTLNCRVVRTKNGLHSEVQTTKSPGIVGQRLRQVVESLSAARDYAETEHQRSQIDYTIKYLNEGDVEDFRQASIEWVRDRSDSQVDFMLGWVEFQGDYLIRMASWESYVQIVDPEVSRIAEAMARHAQYFEDAMPYGTFRKKFPPDYSPPAIMVYYFQEIAALHSGGYNLPNFDDIRRDVGAKNVIRLPMPGEDKDPDLRAMRREAFEEFLPARCVESVTEHREKLWRNLVLMHEIIGHGSGTYDTAKYGKTEDPVSALGALGSALEEQRADLTALVFVDDPKLIEIGAVEDADEAKLFRKLTYDAYLADFLLRTSRGRSFTEPHQRGHWLFINKLLEAEAIGWISRDGSAKSTSKQVLAVLDYDRFGQVARDLLGELQTIKATRQDQKLKELFAKYAPLDDIRLPWAQAVIERGERLRINAGSIEQPWRVTIDGEFESFGGKTLESIAPYWKSTYCR